MSVDVPERARSDLSRKFFAALAATSSKDGATGTRAHTSTETVSLCAAAVVRLERTLGHDYSTCGVRQNRESLCWPKGDNCFNLRAKAEEVKPGCQVAMPGWNKMSRYIIAACRYPQVSLASTKLSP